MEINIIEISGFVTALTGLRLPFKKDVRSGVSFYLTDDIPNEYTTASYCLINNKDIELLQSLIKQGDSDAKVLRFIDVSLEINAARYFWSEFDTYKVGTVTISESTMHTILKDELTVDKFNYAGNRDFIEIVIKRINDIKNSCYSNNEKLIFIKQILPEGFLQKRIVKLNYQTLRHIYFDRRNHRLTEWQEFCNFIETLPMSELITCKKE